MNTIARRIAIVLSATAVTIGLLGTAAQAADDGGNEGLKNSSSNSARDTQWGG